MKAFLAEGETAEDERKSINFRSLKIFLVKKRIPPETSSSFPSLTAVSQRAFAYLFEISDLSIS
jgi:hypothetical protein